MESSDPISIECIDNEALEDLREVDKEFLTRMYDGGLSNYQERLKAVGFDEKTHVLDAGCGFGQWSFSLETLGVSATGVDAKGARVKVADRLRRVNGSEVRFLQSALESLPFPDESFDGVFCYSTLYFTDYRRSIEEFFRVLEPGGRIYACTNGLGKYLSDIVQRPNPSADYDPRRYALKTIRNTLLGQTDDLSLQDGTQVMSPSQTRHAFEEVGFDVLKTGGEGTVTVDGREPGPSFYNARYLGLPNVFEVVAKKPEQ